MKYSAFVALIASAQAVHLEYAIYDPEGKLNPPIWSVVKRGAVRDFADDNVKKAMEANPTSGSWPIAPAPKDIPKIEEKPHFEKQPWESVVKKGNSAFSDTQVEKALKLIPEPIAIGGKAIAGGGEKGDASATFEAIKEKKEADLAIANAKVPDEAPKAGEKVLPASPAETVPAAEAPAAKAEAPAAKAEEAKK